MHDKFEFQNFLKHHNISELAYNLFELYETILTEKNKKFNLVSNTSLEKIWLTHFFDSTLIADIIDLSDSRILDFGSGGGFPGIPLKIIYPSIKLFCVESIRKKVLFLKFLKQELDLQDTTIIQSRFEDVENSLENSLDYITVRAVKMNDVYFRKAFSLLKPLGKLIIYKSKVNIDEVDKIKQYADCETTEIIRKEYSRLGKRAFIIVKKYG